MQKSEETDSMKVGQFLMNRGEFLSVAESCTGGLLCDLVVQTAGSSAWFTGGWVTYSNKLKQEQLEVSEHLISEHGAVSWQVAAAMCAGAMTQSGATISLSTTGIAGPDGGTTEKPVGTMFIGCHCDGVCSVREFCFEGNREEIRVNATTTAMRMLLVQLSGKSEHSMPFQQGDVHA